MRSPEAVLELRAYHDAWPQVFDDAQAGSANPQERATKPAARTAARLALEKLRVCRRRYRKVD
jgi:hypothetical protein